MTFMEWMVESMTGDNSDMEEDETLKDNNVSYSAKKQAIKSRERVFRQQASSKDPQERQIGRLNVQKNRLQDKQLQKERLAQASA